LERNIASAFLFSRPRSLTIADLTATEEFDKLCFDYGLELDEDVCADNCPERISSHLNALQTTAEVEEAIKKGLPAERPVSNHCGLLTFSCISYTSTAIENRDSGQQASSMVLQDFP
jgi:hypothetical protein